MRRLRTLLLANNRISVLSQSLHLSVPNLTTLVLTNNNVSELGDLEPLKDMKSLKYLSLLGNPVREKKWYRDWLVWRISGLRVLDFQRIKDKVGDLCLPASTQTRGLTETFRNANKPRGCSSRRTTFPTRWQPSSWRQCRPQQLLLSLLMSLARRPRRED
jgi:Leucine-rich repeat (LRR) protein